MIRVLVYTIGAAIGLAVAALASRDIIPTWLAAGVGVAVAFGLAESAFERGRKILIETVRAAVRAELELIQRERSQERPEVRRTAFDTPRRDLVPEFLPNLEARIAEPRAQSGA